MAQEVYSNEAGVTIPGGGGGTPTGTLTCTATWDAANNRVEVQWSLNGDFMDNNQIVVQRTLGGTVNWVNLATNSHQAYYYYDAISNPNGPSAGQSYKYRVMSHKV